MMIVIFGDVMQCSLAEGTFLGFNHLDCLDVVFRSFPVKDYCVFFCSHIDVWDCDAMWFGTWFVHVGVTITVTFSVCCFIKNAAHLLQLLFLLNKT